MSITVGIPVAGEMGAGIGGRLTENGAMVPTILSGRSEATHRRAGAAGMAPADAQTVAGCDIVLSIVPPGIAVETARLLAPYLGAKKPLFIDCNAVSPKTVGAVGRIVTEAGASFLDAGIIGGPPRPGGSNPPVYVSGPGADRALALAALGLDIRLMEGGIGAASAFKMSYAGLSKGLVAMASALMLAARRAGVDEALHAELASSQASLLARFEKTVPAMYPKAYRWVAEMREIALFLEDGGPESGIYESVAEFYERIAADHAGPRRETAALDAFLALKD